MAQGRKGQKRAPRKQPPVDDDLNMLASVIAEYQLDNTAYGWFRPLWKNGLNAAALARDAARAPGVADGLGMAAERDAMALLDRGLVEPDLYEKCGAVYTALVQPKINTNTCRLLAVGLRCMQLSIARSDGGGTVYNELLIPVFLPLDPKHVELLVLEHRCKDAIGTTSHLKGDRNDRQRSAFRIAWQRGLYLAAYAISPAF